MKTFYDFNNINRNVHKVSLESLKKGNKIPIKQKKQSRKVHKKISGINKYKKSQDILTSGVCSRDRCQ